MQIELKRLQARTGITFVFVTHDQEEALTMSDRVAVMQGGKLMQVAHPQSIYERPANLFVAEFIGDANFLPAVCVRREGRGGCFRLASASTDSADILVQDANDLAERDRAVLVVRPERLSLVARESARLTAVVRELIYNGSDTAVHASLADGTSVRIRIPSGTGIRPAVGAECGLAMPADAVQVFAA
jgi:spermidine/putrescine transport system ATP-binding protein